jgi:nitrogen-specific signal transduction histidine kinase
MNDLGWIILQALPEPVIFIDAEHAIQFMNPAACELFEVPNIDDVIGTAFNNLLPGGTGLMTYKERIESVKRINEFAINPVPTPKPDDEQIWSGGPKNKIFYFHAVPVHDRGKKNIGYVIKIDDITKERLASEYLHGLPSDMFSPIEVIRGYSELLLLEKHSENLTDDQRKYLIRIKESGNKLLDFRNSIIEGRR